MDKVEMEVYLAAVEAEEVESLKTAMEYIGKAFDALDHVCSEDGFRLRGDAAGLYDAIEDVLTELDDTYEPEEEPYEQYEEECDWCW